MMRAAYLVLGWLSVGVGLIGVVVPLLPTTVFMILAAYLFAKGSPRSRAWLMERTRFGAHIRNWEADGSIEPRAKRLAVGCMVAVVMLSVLLGAPWWVVLAQVVCIGPVGVYVWTRPDPR